MRNLSIQFGFAACPKNMSLAEGGQMLKYRHFTQNPILPRYSLTLLRPMYELREVETRYVRRMLPQTLAAPKNLAMADA